MFRADEALDVGGQRVGGERAGGDDRPATTAVGAGIAGDLLADDA